MIFAGASIGFVIIDEVDGRDCPNCFERHAQVVQQVQGNVWADSHVPLARVRVEVEEELGYSIFYFAPEAYQVLAFHGMIADVIDHVEPRGAGEYVIPRSIIDREVAEDVERQLDYMSSFEDTDGMSSFEDMGGQCALPTCMQDGTDDRRGFRLCREHADVLQGWDDLVDA